ncbi:MAG: helix-turn-helix domain-containing protein [Endomicrobium sp.]|nr:helix-turn-helix domain-containing protein [Endomicrobium sp.]
MKQKKVVGKTIKAAAFDAGLTQTELAKRLGVKQQLISKWITGYLNPKLSTLEKIAKATSKPLSYFLDNEGSEYYANAGDNFTVGRNIKIGVDAKEMELLKKEIELLREENAFLREQNTVLKEQLKTK